MNGDILKMFVEYCYGAEIVIDSVNVAEMMEAAEMMLFPDIKQSCAKFLENNLHLSASNCLMTRELADFHNLGMLKKRAHNLVLDHFVEVSQGDDFLQLNAKRLSALLSEDELDVPAEKNVFDALMRWMKHDVDGRKKSLETLLDCIRFEYLKDSVSESVKSICVLHISLFINLFLNFQF